MFIALGNSYINREALKLAGGCFDITCKLWKFSEVPSGEFRELVFLSENTADIEVFMAVGITEEHASKLLELGVFYQKDIRFSSHHWCVGLGPIQTRLKDELIILRYPILVIKTLLKVLDGLYISTKRQCYRV